MAGSDAVGAEAIGGVVFVVAEQRLPMRVEMLDDHELVTGGVGVDYPLDDTQGAVEPAGVAGDIGQGEKGLGGVHVAVGAAVGFDTAPVLGEGLEHHALFFAPEKLLDDVDRVVQQGLCTRSTGHHRRAGGQGDKRMQVGGLATVAIEGTGRCEPATVLAVAQRAAQGRNTVLDEFGIARQALGMGHGEAVGHARGVHCFGVGVGRQLAVVVQVAKTLGQARGLGECQQALAFCGKPGVMGRCIQPTAGRQWLRGHGWPLLFFVG